MVMSCKTSCSLDKTKRIYIGLVLYCVQERLELRKWIQPVFSRDECCTETVSTCGLDFKSFARNTQVIAFIQIAQGRVS